VPKAGRSREQLEKHRTTGTQVLFQSTAELGFFHFLEIVTGWLVPSAGTFHRRRSPLLKTGFSRQIRELKLQMKNSRECFTYADKGSFVQVPRFATKVP
jgi:hypothetical protein